MLTDAAALALSLVAARLAAALRRGAMTYGLGRAEILSAQANGVTLLVLALLIVYDAITPLVSPPHVDGRSCSRSPSRRRGQSVAARVLAGTGANAASTSRAPSATS